ncbi:hypothetical protein F7725_011703, partial [Dissostichus mawsoni]
MDSKDQGCCRLDEAFIHGKDCAPGKATTPNPTCGQILPILRKLDKHFTVDEEGDTVLVSSLKQAVWGNLSKRYQTDGIRNFLEEAPALDPRFKHHVEDSTVWDRIKEKVMVGKLTESEQPTEQDRGEEDGVTQQQSLTQRENEEEEDGEESEEEQEQPPPCSSKRAKMTLLEELFAAEDSLKIKNLSTSTTSTQQYQTDRELKLYPDMPTTMTSDDPAAWCEATKSLFIRAQQGPHLGPHLHPTQSISQAQPGFWSVSAWQQDGNVSSRIDFPLSGIKMPPLCGATQETMGASVLCASYSAS